jgi:hypothetical protein
MKKLLVLLAFVAAPLAAQIQDNSFLVEEAYNQEPGVVQHIFTFARADKGGDWGSTFTQEWPVRSLRHQLSYTVPMQRGAEGKGLGDVLVNYRYQLVGSGESRLAVSPRISLVVPSGSERRGLGTGAAGVQLMLPVSAALPGNVVAHWNAGANVTPSQSLRQYVLGQSLIWVKYERVNPLVEVLWTGTHARGAAAENELVVNPGVRWSHDVNHVQIVPGIAFPVTVRPRFERGVFLYLSIEHPFRAL